ncbi:hypothetical protein CR152_31425 [Massilia violaceinigra]|uniref:Uncharacterized protein n=1 Tax=Massilia violaceinigra TaxID=2045208 RepID=A0A2D2DU62_9BURK|nr:hypothetical protein [Massilia violaceinigra]ATQ78524.1 hypothetical protein CR152_31425 [Massilia violaceinigra]
MKTDNRFWRDVAAIVAVGLVVCGIFWLLLNAYYTDEMPAVVRNWMPVIVFVISVGYLIEDRMSYPAEQPGQDSAAPAEDQQPNN